MDVIADDQHTTIERFLTMLWGADTEGQLVLFHQKQGHRCPGPGCTERHTFFYSCADRQKREQFIDASLIITAREDEQVYFGVSLFDANRRVLENTMALPGFWADIDVGKPNTPPDREAALDFLDSLPLQPTLVVSTGSGIHAYWLFPQPWTFASGDDRKKAANYSERWQLGINQHATPYGWEFDTTSDLPRILRLPGTLNWKSKPPQLVVVLNWDGPRHTLDDFTRYLGTPTPEPKDYQKSGTRISGGRHKFLMSWAGRLHKTGLSFEGTLGAIQQVNLDQCDPSLDPEDVESSLQRNWGLWTKRRSKGKQKEETPKPVPFPIHTFPEPVAVFLREAARSFDSDPAMVALPVLATLSAAIGGARYLEVKKDWDEFAVIFGAVVSAPGTKKSPIQKRALRPLSRNEFKHKVAFDFLWGQYQNDLDIWNATPPRQRAQNNMIKPVRPVMVRRLISDITVEKLADILMENPRGVLQELDELTALLRGFNQYKGGDGSDRSNFLSMWNAGMIRVDRRNRELPLIVPRTFLSVIGGIQPTLLNEIADRKGRSDGMVERFLFVNPVLPARRLWNKDEEISEEAEASYSEVVEKLLTLPMMPRVAMIEEDDPFATNPDVPPDAPVPQPVWFDASGETEWARLYQAHMDETDTQPYHLRVAYVKLDNYAARLSLILHLTRWAAGETDSLEVQGESVRRAFVLLEYFKEQTKAVFRELATTPKDRALDNLWKWLQGRADDEVSLRTILLSHVAGKTREDVVPLLRRLLDNGDIRILRGELDKVGSSVTLKMVPRGYSVDKV